MLFELVTGRPPFKGDSPVAIAYQHVGEAPPRPSTFNPEVDGSLDAVVLHALVKDREARYQDATSFRADLQAARLGRPISAAARGTAAGAGVGAGAAAATVAMHTLASGERTTVLGAGTSGVPGSPVEGHHGNTATLPAIGHDPDEEPRKRRGLAYVLLVLAVLGAVAVMALAGKSLFNRPPATADMVTVPSVVDLPVSTAEAKIRAIGLIPEAQDVPSTKEQGLVVDQNPSANDRVNMGSKVTLSVSGGPNTVEVPDLAGFTVEEATAALKNLGLSVGGTQKVNNTRVDKDKIVESSPAAGQSVNVGSAVRLKVSSGKVVVPDVVGLTRDEAAGTLSDLGFRNKTTYVISDKPEDTVLRQSITKGNLADYGTQVMLTVARPAPPTPTTTTTPPPTTTTTPAGPTTTVTLPTMPTTPTSTP
jgi:serine/threonine-protein kinase